MSSYSWELYFGSCFINQAGLLAVQPVTKKSMTTLCWFGQLIVYLLLVYQLVDYQLYSPYILNLIAGFRTLWNPLVDSFRLTMTRT